MNKVLLPKDDQRLPDSYGIEIKYVTGRTDKLEIASHKLNDGLLEIWTHEDTKISWIPIQNIERIEFDSRFTKMIEIKFENENKK